MTDDLHVLAELDPARPADPRAHATAAARAMLASVLAAPTDAAADDGGPDAGGAVPGVTQLTGRRRRRVVRVAVVVGVAAALAVGAIVLPHRGEDSALASWTATPGSLSSDATLTAAEQCRTLASAARGDDPSGEVLGAMAPALAERRGGFRLVVIAGGGWQAECLLNGTGGGTAGLSNPSVRAGLDPLGPEDVRQGTSSSLLVDGGYVVSVIGDVGPDVMAVTVHPDDVKPVHATVAGGHFAAFWPATTPRSQHLTELTATLVLRSGEVRSVELGPE